jgi:hypothetical protein
VRAESDKFYGFIRTFMTIASADNPVIFFPTAEAAEEINNRRNQQLRDFPHGKTYHGVPMVA